MTTTISSTASTTTMPITEHCDQRGRGRGNAGDPSADRHGDPHNIHTFDSNDEHVIGGNAQCIAAAGNQAAIDQLGEFGCYVQRGTAITPPAPGNVGNMRRNVVYGPGFVNLDSSVIKDFKFGERFSHPNFADPDHDLSDGP